MRGRRWLFGLLVPVLVLSPSASSAQVPDDARPEVAVSVDSLSVTERESATYAVSLTGDPGRSGATVEIVVVSRYTNDKIALDRESLTFTGGPDGDWLIPQTVTVTALEDPNRRNELLEITHTMLAAPPPPLRVEGPRVSVEVIDLKWLKQQEKQEPAPEGDDGLGPAEGLTDNSLGFDPTEGLLTAEDLGDVDLSEFVVEPVADLHSLIEQDGTYLWRDGDRRVSMRLLDSPPDPQQAELDELATMAVRSYVPPITDNNTNVAPQQLIATNWFESDTGQLYLLAGGVNVVFEDHVPAAEIAAVFQRHNVAQQHVSPLGELHNAFHIATSSDTETLSLVEALTAEPATASVSPNWATPLEPLATGYGPEDFHCSRFAKVNNLDDELAGCLWHLDSTTDYRSNGVDPTIDINLADAWDTTKGENVIVAVVDSQWNPEHEDLKDNADESLSTNWHNVTAVYGDYHGSNVAGIIGARDNRVGGVGVAPRATLINFDLLGSHTDRYRAAAMSLHQDVVAVSNHSYGYGLHYGLVRTSDAWKRAVTAGITSGYGGRGQTYVTASGNGRGFLAEGWSSHAEQANHVGIINVGAVDSRGGLVSYSEVGPTVWVTAPSRESGQPGILAPHSNDRYTDSFGGTSAASPQVAGVAALVRSANPRLTWRDVKVIIANTAQHSRSQDPSLVQAGLKHGSQTQHYLHSHHYGFGVVNAGEAVDAALDWTLLPALQTSSASAVVDADLPGTIGETNYEIEVSSEIDFIEHIDVNVDMTIDRVRDLRLTLVSPSGQESILSQEAPECPSECGLNGAFQFASARFLGMEAAGAWQLRVQNFAENADREPCDPKDSSAGACPAAKGQFNSWEISIYGHESAASTARRVTLSADSTSVSEGGAAVLTAAVSGDPLAADLAVPITLSEAGATTGDYEPLDEIVIAAGATSASAQLATIDDTLLELDEQIVASVGALPTGYIFAGGAVTVTIVDDEPAPIARLVLSSETVDEGESITITAALNAPAPTDTVLTLSRRPTAPAVHGDGNLTGERQLTIPAGSTVSRDSVAFQSNQTVAHIPVRKFRIAASLLGESMVSAPEPVWVSIIDDDPPPPEVSLGVSTGAVHEGGVVEVRATLTGSRRAQDVTIPLKITDGTASARDYRAPESVVIPAGAGSGVARIHVMDDLVDEPDETFTVALATVPRVVVFTGESHSVTVLDNDGPWLKQCAAELSGDTATVESVTAWRDQYRNYRHHVQLLNSVLAAFGEDTGETPMTVEETDLQAQRSAPQHWAQVRKSLETLAACTVAAQAADAPAISVTAGPDVLEGETLLFTVSADPAPDEPLEVSVTVTARGDFLVWENKFTVTIPTSGSQLLRLSSNDDDIDEPDGAATATIDPGDGYNIAATAGAATLAVLDDDEEPLPQVTLTLESGSDATEADEITVTLTADPAPAAPLTVELALIAHGDFGVATGTRTVTIPHTGTATLSLPLDDDSIDEPDGGLAVILNDGANYTTAVQSAGWINITDNDEPPTADEPPADDPPTTTSDPPTENEPPADDPPPVEEPPAVVVLSEPPPAGGPFIMVNRSTEESIHVTVTPVHRHHPGTACTPTSDGPGAFTLQPGQSSGTRYLQGHCDWRHQLTPANDACTITIDITNFGVLVATLTNTAFTAYGSQLLGLITNPDTISIHEAHISTTCTN